MPVLNYYDPATQSYKPVVGGMTQDSVVALTGRRNVIRNGDMSVYQRGVGPFTSGYTVDGWSVWVQGGTTTFNRVGQPLGLGAPWYQAEVTGQAIASSIASIWLPVENVNTLSGQVVTLSFDGMVNAGTRRVDICIEQFFGSGGSATTDTPFLGPTLTTTKTRHSVTFTMPSTVGKTSAGQTASCVWIGLIMSVGSNNAGYAAPGLGTNNGTYSFTDVQLEAGNVATPFERIPIPDQLAWCQRYLAVPVLYSSSDVQVPLQRYSTTGGIVSFWLPVALRTVPTFTYTGGMGRMVAYDTNFSVIAPNITALALGPIMQSHPSYVELIVTYGATTGANSQASWDPLSQNTTLYFSAEQ